MRDGMSADGMAGVFGDGGWCGTGRVRASVGTMKGGWLGAGVELAWVWAWVERDGVVVSCTSRLPDIYMNPHPQPRLLLNYNPPPSLPSSYHFPPSSPPPTPPQPPPNPSTRLEVRNRIRTRLHPARHIPILNQTRPDHPPDAGDIPLPERDAVAAEVDGAEGRAGEVGADEDALDVDGAAFELGGLEGDDDRGAVLSGVCVSGGGFLRGGRRCEGRFGGWGSLGWEGVRL